MKFILDIVEPYLSDAKTGGTSLACISTSNPVYLVFEAGENAPSLIVRSADSTDVVRAHKVTEALYQEIPELLPQPVAIVSTDEGEYAIQRGVAGLPWFQIANEFNTTEAWEELRQGALAALEKLHGAIASQSDAIELNLYDYAQRCLSDAQSHGLSLSDAQLKGLNTKLDALKGIAPVASFPQHGDYCLNNLIIEQSQMHIIDFEDYGMTSLPLFDQFSLALSLSSSAPAHLVFSLESEITQCTQTGLAKYALSPEHVGVLFVVHLLVRLGEWSAGSRRAEFRAFLEAELKKRV